MKPVQDFADRKFLCVKCKKHIADERLDRQILVVGNLAFFNFARFSHIGCAVNKWQSPRLNKIEKLEDLPDNINDSPQPSKDLLESLLTI